MHCWFLNSYADVSDLLVGDEQVFICFDVKYFADITAFEFDCVIGVIDHSGVDIERIYFDVIIVLDHE